APLVETQLTPDLVDSAFNLVVHGNGAAPFASGLAGPFAGRIQPHFRSQPRHRRGKVEIINRGVFHHHGVTNRVHARGDGPNDVMPVTGVNVTVTDNHEFGVHELT